MEKNYNLYLRDNLDAITPDELEQALASLPPWRREKALRFKFAQGRKECAMAYLLLCQALRADFGIHIQPTFVVGPHGKPSLLECPHIHFNLSHCKKGIACVISERAEVGVDIECIGRCSEPLARHVLCDAELAAVHSAPDPQLAFTRFWTQKEAVVKLTGRGIDDDLQNLLARSAHLCLHTADFPDRGYVLSIASEMV